ncbi:peptidoglycan hydrolase-like protein with peptidoglycan-binding domain [Devosia sp. UYZn731]|uniref:peptidoglycan-binding domain-containing protein n=1 Tax=Devosia sp. UYZn731 TaxID=3156345 RepID=UPI0033931426
MTDSTLTRLPLLAGGAVAASLSRAGLWTFSRYMRAPLASTALLAMVTLTALAGSNALYFQTARHPAPLFAPAPDVPETAAIEQVPEAPALPQLRQAEVPQPISQETTSSVAQPAPVVPDAPVGNAQVFELQKKLTELKLFDGTVDGFYGPMTARAIRAFEEHNGMTPTGAISPGLVDAILRADTMGMAPQRVQVAEVAPQPAPVRTIRAAKVQLPPMPLAPVNAVQAPTPVEDAFDTVTSSAAQTIDSIVAAVDGSRVTPATATLRPTAALPLMAATAQPMPAPVQHVASLEPVAPPAVIIPQPEATRQAAIAPAAAATPTSNAQLIEQVQRGLASLGFLQGAIDGKPGEATAKAIRAFEIFHNYAPTGEVNPQLVGLLRDAGASI